MGDAATQGCDSKCGLPPPPPPQPLSLSLRGCCLPLAADASTAGCPGGSVAVCGGAGDYHYYRNTADTDRLLADGWEPYHDGEALPLQLVESG